MRISVDPDRLKRAQELVQSLHRSSENGFTLKAKLEADRDGDYAVVFTGGRWGEAQIWLSVSSDERIIAHFEGYCVANNLAPRPNVGDKVLFPSGSSSTGWRRGKVVSVGPKRATVTYRFKNGREAAPKSVPIQYLRFGWLDGGTAR